MSSNQQQPTVPGMSQRDMRKTAPVPFSQCLGWSNERDRAWLFADLIYLSVSPSFRPHASGLREELWIHSVCFGAQ